MNDKNIEVWLRIFEAVCTLHSVTHGSGSDSCEEQANAIYARLMIKYKREQQYGTQYGTGSSTALTSPEDGTDAQ